MAILTSMGKFRRAFRKLKENYDVLLSKKYTTIAGTLVFFLIMSIVPMAFWLSLLFGKLPVGNEQILSLPVFDTVKEMLLFIQAEASAATDGASVLLLVTTLYSATNLFYQMRCTGEIVYDYRLKRQGIKMRLQALALLFFVMVFSVFIVVFFTFLSFLASQIFVRAVELIVDYLLIAIGAFALILMLNAYVCPYKVPLTTFLPGAAFTVGAWAVSLIGFAIYLRFSTVTRLYGALSAIIVFLLWLYLLMIGFVVGVVLNSKRIIGKERLYNC